MTNFEFLKYDATPGEKHLGIATIRYLKKIILRMKVTPKDTGGYFVHPASYKISNMGKDGYISAFQLDSTFESDEMKEFVLNEITKILAPNGFVQQIETPQFSPTQPAISSQSKPNYNAYPQQPSYAPQAQHAQQYRQDQPAIAYQNENIPF